MVTIAADRVTVRLGARAVPRDVSIRLESGCLTGIIGPNGAGKSTLIRALLGLIPADGTILLDGDALTALSRAAIARRIAYLPQGQTLHWPLSVERIVALGRLPHLAPFSRLSQADDAAIGRALAQLGIAHLRDRTATALSGGERARVLLARALAVEAPALLVDEPLASLDPGHQLEVMDLLRAQARAGTTVAAVLHDLGLAARYCDRLVLLVDGEVAGDGAPAEVLTADALARAFGVRVWRGEAGGEPLIVPIART